MSAPERSAAELIASCLEANSVVAWKEFVSRFQPLIASVIIRTLRRYGTSNLALVDDLVQETFLRLCKDNCKVLRNFKLEFDNSLHGYLKVAAASVTMDYLRAQISQKRAGERLAEPEDVIDRHVSTAPNADQSIALTEVDRCVERISDNGRDREIFWLYYQQGFSVKDLAQMQKFGLTAKGIESCIYRMTKAVRYEIFTDSRSQPASTQNRPPTSTCGGRL